MKRALLTTVVFVATTAAAAAASINCISSKGLAVDADGAPDSYRVDGRGLSYTCDGVFAVVNGLAHTQNNDPQHWRDLCTQYWTNAKATGDYTKVKIVGFLKDVKGRPIVQGRDDPLPGEAFVTTTSLTIPGVPDSAQRRYVNAREIPYVVLSPAYASTHHLRLGDLVAVYRPKTDKIAFGVYGDCCSVGEASVRLHQDLGNDPIVIDADGAQRAERGIEDRVVFVSLTGAHTHPTLDAQGWRDEIRAKGEKALETLGGLVSVKTCHTEN